MQPNVLQKLSDLVDLYYENGVKRMKRNRIVRIKFWENIFNHYKNSQLNDNEIGHFYNALKRLDIIAKVNILNKNFNNNFF
jgi:hypothetical protein